MRIMIDVLCQNNRRGRYHILKLTICDEVRVHDVCVKKENSAPNVRGSERERGGTLGQGCGWNNISSRAPCSLFSSSRESDTQQYCWTESGVACLSLSLSESSQLKVRQVKVGLNLSIQR